VIGLAGLLCLSDTDGPCANAVEDRSTKTGPGRRRTLTLIWGTAALPDRAGQAEAWHRGCSKPMGRPPNLPNRDPDRRWPSTEKAGEAD
jgi:hypothetical protein